MQLELAERPALEGGMSAPAVMPGRLSRLLGFLSPRDDPSYRETYDQRTAYSGDQYQKMRPRVRVPARDVGHRPNDDAEPA